MLSCCCCWAEKKILSKTFGVLVKRKNNIEYSWLLLSFAHVTKSLDSPALTDQSAWLLDWVYSPVVVQGIRPTEFSHFQRTDPLNKLEYCFGKYNLTKKSELMYQ